MQQTEAPPAVLIATLGSAPQVVTLALDLLLAQDHELRQLVVVHTAAGCEPVTTALHMLSQEWATYAPYGILGFARVEIVSPAGPVADVDTEAGAEAAFRAIYGAVVAAKRQGFRIHLSIAGGRKTMAVYGMAVAQLLFDEGDRLWHLFSNEALQGEQRLHARPDDAARLVPVPILRWSETSPMLTELAQSDDPFEAVRRQRELQARSRHQRVSAFVEQVLTPAEREAVVCLVREGLRDRDIAERLCKSERTVAHQLSAAYDKARTYFGVEDAGRHTLIALLGDYLRTV